MKIVWGRVLNAGLIAEILLIVVFQIVVALFSQSNAANLTMILGSFIFMLVGALWVGRKIESRFILHGFLVGIVAIVYYVIRTLPEVLSGEYANYWVIALWGHTPKLIGGIVGGYIAGKRRKTATS